MKRTMIRYRIQIILALLAGMAVVSGCPQTPAPVTVPNVAGMPRANAEAEIVAAGLAIGAVTESFSDTVVLGAVISQSLEAGTSVPAGSVVDLVVSKGPETTEPEHVEPYAVDLQAAVIAGLGEELSFGPQDVIIVEGEVRLAGNGFTGVEQTTSDHDAVTVAYDVATAEPGLTMKYAPLDGQTRSYAFCLSSGYVGGGSRVPVVWGYGISQPIDLDFPDPDSKLSDGRVYDLLESNGQCVAIGETQGGASAFRCVIGDNYDILAYDGYFSRAFGITLRDTQGDTQEVIVGDGLASDYTGNAVVWKDSAMNLNPYGTIASAEAAADHYVFGLYDDENYTDYVAIWRDEVLQPVVEAGTTDAALGIAHDGLSDGTAVGGLSHGALGQLQAGDAFIVLNESGQFVKHNLDALWQSKFDLTLGRCDEARGIAMDWPTVAIVTQGATPWLLVCDARDLGIAKPTE